MMSPEARAALDRAVAQELATGAQLESQTSTNAVLRRGKPVNHILHLILSVLTAGIWLIVWAILVATNKPQRIVLSLNEQGQVERTVATAA